MKTEAQDFLPAVVCPGQNLDVPILLSVYRHAVNPGAWNSTAISSSHLLQRERNTARGRETVHGHLDRDGFRLRASHRN